jgi:Protein of unknown function (DUF3022)
MTVALDRRQSLTEIEHALSKSFPYSSTSITDVTGSDDTVTIQISWVASAGNLSILDSRCALNLVFEPGAIERYRALEGARRLHAREALRAIAEEALNDERRVKGATDLMECNLTLPIDAARIDAAAQGHVT